jgi:prolyl-tRNA editing enzyme YbaK/EbsC (Cys-tRNA(Pro) deacylase)
MTESLGHMNTPATLTSMQLNEFITDNCIEAEILRMGGCTTTVEDAARELGVETDRIIKSLVFMAGDEPVLVINNGLARVDRKKLGGILGLGRKPVKFAAAAQALKITGFAVGAMPPFGHRRKLRTLVDAGLADMDTVYGGGGDLNAMLRLTSAELLRVTGAEVVPISE